MRMDTMKIRLPIATLVAAGLVGCGPLTQQRLDVSLPQTPTPLAVDVFNEKGSVEVRVNPRLQSPRVQASIRWTNALDEEEAEALAASVEITSRVEQSAGGAILRVRAQDMEPNLPEHRVHLRIALPRIDGVRVINAGGDVILAGVAGAVQVENATGAIELRTDKALHAPVALIAGRGNVYFQAPVGSQGAFDLRSEQGEVAFVSRRAMLADMRATPATITGVLAQGVNPITLRSGAGDVRAWVIEKPMELVRAFR